MIVHRCTRYMMPQGAYGVAVVAVVAGGAAAAADGIMLGFLCNVIPDLCACMLLNLVISSGLTLTLWPNPTFFIVFVKKLVRFRYSDSLIEATLD